MKKIKIFIAAITLAIVFSAFTINNDKYFEIIKNLEIFTNVYKELNTNYVDELDPATLMRTGIDAMVGSLDPYTKYYSEAQGQSYRIATDGTYSGFGAQSKQINGLVTVTEVFEGGAAQKSGIRAGDQIVKVDGASVRNMKSEELSRILRGAIGTKVALGIVRPSKGDLTIELSREKVEIPNVPYYAEVAENIGYISLTTFTANASGNIMKALHALKKENDNLEGLILDLRNNGGGLLHEAINICNLFIPAGIDIVDTKGKIKDRDISYKTKNTPEDLEIKLAVLINSRSASASEIVSGVMQDLDRGVLLGQRSFGKGLVQNTKKSGYNSMLKITTSKYYIPSGRCIQGKEYEDGKPVDIPDDQRAVYYTSNGRKVLDGGGVTPDVKLEKVYVPSIIQALTKQDMIFNYVTEYCIQHASIDSIGMFVFDDYDGFTNYIDKKDFNFETKSEKSLHTLLENSEEEKYKTTLEQQIDNLKSIIKKEKADDLVQYKNQIINLIEQEIASRYYYQKGKIQQSLKNDNELAATIKLLNNGEEYNSLLSGK